MPGCWITGRLVLQQWSRGNTTLAKTKATAAANPQPQTERIQALLKLVLESLDDGKAEEVVVLDLAEKTSIADYMVVASGRSSRQVITLAEHLAETLKAELGHPIPVEGQTHGDWVLVDGSDIIIHIFRPEVRSFYALEKMWGAALDEPEEVTVPDLRVEPVLAAGA